VEAVLEYFEQNSVLQSPSDDRTLVRLRRTIPWRVFLTEVGLKTTPVEYNIERSLREVKTYWSTIVTKEQTRGMVRARRMGNQVEQEPLDIVIGFLGALKLREQDREEESSKEIEGLSQAMAQSIRLHEPSLLYSLVRLFSAHAWVRHEELFGQVAKYIVRACHENLGPLHPLNTILSTLAQLPLTSKVVDECAELVYQAMVDTAQEHQGHVRLDPYYVHAVEESLLGRMQRRLDPCAIQHFIVEQLARYKRSLGPRSRHTVSLQSVLATMYFDEALREVPGSAARAKAEADGKAILETIVAQGENYPRDRVRIATYSMAAQSLAQFHYAKQDFGTAQQYYSKALVWAVEKFDVKHVHVSLVLKELKALQRMMELELDAEVVDADQQPSSNS
jgi:hypothetical protein